MNDVITGSNNFGNKSFSYVYCTINTVIIFQKGAFDFSLFNFSFISASYYVFPAFFWFF